MAEKENQQYKWRQRKKRNTLLTIWVIVVILVAAAATFVYEGMKSGDPLKVAKKYIENQVGVTDYQTATGSRSLNADNQFVQDYTFTYTADGKEVTKTLNLVQQPKKKYGLFEQWDVVSKAAGATMNLELIAPKGSQVLVNGVAPGSENVKEDANLSSGAVCYQIDGIEADQATLQVNGLPFDSFEMNLDPKNTVLDIRDMLVVGENAKTQMTEIGKQMINELFTAVVQKKGADSLGTLFANSPNKNNLYTAIEKNLYKDNVLQINSITFKEFKPTFGDVYYPGKDEDAYIGIEMKLSYTCEYEPVSGEAETEAQTEEETTEQTTEKTQKDSKSAVKEATFYFKYINGTCTVTTVEVPNAIS